MINSCHLRVHITWLYLTEPLVNDAGKYTLAVGETEDFSPMDFFTIIPSAWLDTKFFFEDYVSPTIAISLLVAVPASIMILLVKRLKRMRSTQNLAPSIIFQSLHGRLSRMIEMHRLEFEAIWILFLRNVTRVRWNPERYRSFEQILLKF